MCKVCGQSDRDCICLGKDATYDIYIQPNKESFEEMLNEQEGGSHYQKGSIQPVEYILANELDFCEGNVVKYVTRHRYKDGKKDIKKAIQYLNFILEDTYGK